jgi:hypothetical protein
VGCQQASTAGAGGGLSLPAGSNGTKTTFSVTYNANGGTGSVLVDSNAYASGDKVTVLPAAGIAKTGSTFSAWNTKADANGTSYSPGGFFTITGNVTLYAIWTGGTGPVPSSEKNFLSFAIPSLSVTGAITTGSHTVSIYVPLKSNVTALIPTFTLSDGASAKIGSVAQASGVSSNNYSSDVTYTVTAADASTQTWTVKTKQWAPVSTPGASYRVLTASGSTVYAGSDGYGCSISKDSGATWADFSNSTLIGSSRVYDVELANSKIYFATGAGLAVSADDGVSWTRYNKLDGTTSSMVIWDLCISGSKIYAASDSGLFVSGDDCKTWITLSNKKATRVTVLGNTVYSNMGTSQSLMSLTDGDTVWKPFTTIQYVNVIVASGSNLYVGTGYDGLWVTSNNGTNWTAYTTANGLSEDRITAIMIDNTDIYVGTYLGVSVSSSGGSSWRNFTPAVNGTPTGFVRAFLLMNSKLYTGGDNGLCVTDTSGTFN